jgi:hypothetical protein
MTIGTSLFLLAAGAILRYAVNDSIDSVDLETIGLILMIIGVIGLLIGLWQTNRFTRDRVVATDAPPRDPRDRY